MTPEEELIQRYFDAFNRHDIDAVMACFHEQPTLVHGDGKRLTGRDEVRRQYEAEFAACPDGRCDLRLCTGNSGKGELLSHYSMERGSGTAKLSNLSEPR